MIILLTILIILYALTSCKEKIQEKKGNEDNWRVYQQLEEKEEQNIQNPFIREETKCILMQILLERYAYSEIGGTFILI